MTRRENGYKENLDLVLDKIHSLNRDSKRQFNFKEHWASGWDLYLVKGKEERWVYSARTLNDLHNVLCVIYNFLSIERTWVLLNE